MVTYKRKHKDTKAQRKGESMIFNSGWWATLENLRTFPSLKRRGGCAVKEKTRSLLIPRRRGGETGEIFRPEGFAGLTTPSAPSKVLRDILFDVASTPPFQGGENSK